MKKIPWMAALAYRSGLYCGIDLRQRSASSCCSVVAQNEMAGQGRVQ